MNDATATGIAVVLVLICGLYWKLAGMPARLWGVARAELAREHAANDLAVQKALGETVEARAGALLSGLRQYQEQLAANLRRQVQDAELRARVADRHATDTGTTLEAATVLLRELRSTLRELHSQRRTGAASGVDLAPETEPDDSRKTIEAPPPAPVVDPPPAVEPPPAAPAAIPPSSAVAPLPVAQVPAVPRPAPGNLKRALDEQAPSEAARALAQQAVLHRGPAAPAE